MLENKNDSVNFNKNDKQIFFNQVKGAISEIDTTTDWCSITLSVGHENNRLVNFCIKKKDYALLDGKFNILDKVLIRFFLTSRFKNDRWHTIANVISILKMD